MSSSKFSSDPFRYDNVSNPEFEEIMSRYTPARDPRYEHRGWDKTLEPDPAEAEAARLRIMQRYGGKLIPVGQQALAKSVTTELVQSDS